MRSETTKRIVFILLAVGLVIGLLLPAFALAQATPRGCERLASFQRTSAKESERRRGELSDSRAERSQKLDEKLENRSERIAQTRAKFDQKFEEHMQRLESRASNSDQAKAVAAFGQTVKEAVRVRREAVDAARQVFLDGVKAAITARRASVDQALATYQQTVDAAITKAVADCSTGVDPSTVRSELRTAIKAAKDQLRQARTSTEKVGPNVNELAADRREAVSDARDEFKETIEAARDKLKDVLGVRAD